MSSITPTLLSRFAQHLLAASVLIAPATVFAGTPLICHPYQIGTAQTLPGSDGDWKGVNPAYDRKNLERDTLAALKPDTPVIVRMETIRRAAIYATAGMRGWDKDGAYTAEDRAVAHGLLGKLRERAAKATGADRAIALFDVGFFAETLRQTNLDPALDGYDVLRQAVELRGSDPEMEFALALATSWPKRKEQVEHVSRARAGAKTGTLLAANLASHFGG